MTVRSTYTKSIQSNFRKLLLVFACVWGLVGCSASKPYDETEDWSPARIYEEAKFEFESNNFEQGIELLEKLEARYPYGRYAQQAQIDVAYAYYKNGDNVMAMAATDRFIRLYPNHRSLDYVYYLRGLISFNENKGLFSLVSGQDMSERDPKATRSAFDAFKEVVTRFPDSRYYDDSLARLQYLVNSLAQNELHVARYYYEKGAYLAAANRAQEVIKRFEQTPSIEEAIFIALRSYEKLNVEELAESTRRIAQKNFPGSPYWNQDLPEPKPKQGEWWQVWGQ